MPLEINTLVSRIAFDTALPRIRDGLIDEVTISIPLKVGLSIEEADYVVPTLPTPWCCRNHSCGETTRDRDVDLFALFDAPNQFGGILTQLSESNTCHAAECSTSAIPANSTTSLGMPVDARVPAAQAKHPDRRLMFNGLLCAGSPHEVK